MALYRGIALTVAGSDSGGGAGIQADMKTFAALRIFGASALTAVTVQNSRGVMGYVDLPEEIVRGQMEAVLGDFAVGAVKTGMLSRVETIREVAAALDRFGVDRLVVDPVMVAQSGDVLMTKDAATILRDLLFPRALLVTPNVPEAEILAGMAVTNPEDMKEAARRIVAQGARGVLVKGGHLAGETLTDVLLAEGVVTRFEESRIATENTHGTGCTLSAAITAELAAGNTLSEAVRRGRCYLRAALERGFRPGVGPGPVGHAVTMPWVEPCFDRTEEREHLLS